MSDARQFKDLVVGLVKRVERLEGAADRTQLQDSSIENGHLDAYDDAGTVRQVLGRQSDGTFAVSYSNGPAPPKPAPAQVSARELGAVAGIGTTGDPLFVGGKASPADLARFDIHASEVTGFTPDGTTVVGSLVARGAVGMFLDSQTHYIRVVAVSTSGAASEPSDEVEVTPLPASDIAAGSITADQLAANLIVASRLASTNYVEGESGWELEGETGSAEFNDVNMRGQIIAESTDNPDIVLKFGVDALGQASLFWASKSSGFILGQFYIGSNESTDKPAMTLAEGSFHYQLWVMEQAIGFVDDWNGAVYFKSENHGTDRAFLYAGRNSSFDGTPEIEQWQDLTLENGATNGGGPPGYRMMPDGTVMMRGRVDTPPPDFTAVAHLPAEYTPSRDLNIAIALDHGGSRSYTAGRLMLWADGRVEYVDQDPNGSPGWISLDGVRFPVI